MNIREAIHRAQSNDSFIAFDEFDSIYQAIDQENVLHPSSTDHLLSEHVLRQFAGAHFEFPSMRQAFLSGYVSYYWASHRDQVSNVFFARLERAFEQVSVLSQEDIVNHLIYRQRFPQREEDLVFQAAPEIDLNIFNRVCVSSTNYTNNNPSLGIAGFLLSGISNQRTERCTNPHQPSTTIFWNAVLNLFPQARLSARGVEIILSGNHNQNSRNILIPIEEIRARLSRIYPQRPQTNLPLDVIVQPRAGLNLWSSGSRDAMHPPQASFYTGADLSLVVGGRNYLSRSTVQAEMHRFFVLGGYQYTTGDAPYRHLVRAGVGWRMNQHDFHHFYPRIGLEVGVLGLFKVGDESGAFGLVLHTAFDYRFLRRMGAGITIDIGASENGLFMNLGLGLALPLF